MMIFSDIGVPDTFINLGPDTQGLASAYAWMNFLLVLVAFGFLLIFISFGYLLFGLIFSKKKNDESFKQKVYQRFGFIGTLGLLIAVFSALGGIFVGISGIVYNKNTYEISGVITKVSPLDNEIYIDGFDDSLHMKNIPEGNLNDLVGEKETFHCTINTISPRVSGNYYSCNIQQNKDN